jgi:DNA-binding PadR family transcriptional regulator
MYLLAKECGSMFCTAGPWMRHGGRGSFFERGALKFIILDLLKEKPRHGYDIIRALEERSGGYYSPSPGTIYPTLQVLEDMGLVQAKEEDGKKIYELTREGVAYLDEHREHAHEHRERMSEHCPPSGRREGARLMRDMKGVFRDIARSAWTNMDDPVKLEAIREVLVDAKKKIDEIVDK